METYFRYIILIHISLANEDRETLTHYLLKQYSTYLKMESAFTALSDIKKKKLYSQKTIKDNRRTKGIGHRNYMEASI